MRIFNYQPINKRNYHTKLNYNIPWVETKNIIQARSVLQTMINSLPENSSLKIYLLTNCVKLLLPLSESTGISDNGNLPSIELLYDLKEPKNLIFAFKSFYKDFSGVYIFIHKQTENIYIGSAMNFQNRFKAHQINSTRAKRGGNNHFYSFVRNN